MLGNTFHKLLSFFKKYEIYFLGGYFFLFLVANYIYRLSHKSDADLYWARSFDINRYDWLFFLKFNNHFMLFINYPFIKLGVPFWGGFLLYGVVGFLGIYLFRSWAVQVLPNGFRLGSVTLLPFLFWLPNLHIWVANLGKEALIFFGISACLYGSLSLKKHWYYLVIGGFLVLMIRPHVAFMWLLGFVISLFFSKTFSLRLNFKWIILGLFILLISFFGMLQIIKVFDWNWEKIIASNQRSLAFFKSSGSYVPIADYTPFYKWFTFYFRPLFYDVHTPLSLLASIENFVVLFFHIVVVFLLTKKRFKISLPVWSVTILFAAFIAALLFVERYANLGIFMRTKVMFQPFVLVVLMWIWGEVKSD
jgi:hypothetical protein